MQYGTIGMVEEAVAARQEQRLRRRRIDDAKTPEARLQQVEDNCLEVTKLLMWYIGWPPDDTIIADFRSKVRGMRRPG